MKATIKKTKKKKYTKKQKKLYTFVSENVDDKLCYSEDTWSWMNE